MAFVFGNCSNLTFSPNSCSPKPSVSHHGIPIFANGVIGSQFGSVLLRKGFSFGIRLNRIGGIWSDLANGEVKVGSVEKELNFSPNFSDYVKIMESVRVDRNNSDGGRRFGNGVLKKKKEINKKRRSLEADDDSCKEKVRLKETKSGFNSYEKYERKGVSFSKIGGDIAGESVRNNKNVKGKFAREKGYDNGQKKETKLINRESLKGNYGAVGRGREIGDINGKNVRNKERLYQEKETKLENYETVSVHEKYRRANDSVGEYVRNKHEKSKEKYRFVRRERESHKIGGTNVERIKNVSDNYQEKATDFRNFYTVGAHEKSKEKYNAVIRKGNSVTDRIQEDKALVKYENSSQSESTFHQKAKYEHDALVVNNEIGSKYKYIDERAAFKTFEVFTDVKNRPRVLRMEMEERIKALAARLNAENLSIPEWHFSKLMHDAKIRFSDHTILRVVQVLGDYGNWKRALQIVHWLRSRERFKSLKSRYIYTTVLNVLGKANRPLEALNVFFSMREEMASYPDLAAYHCISVTLGQSGLMKELFDVIDCMRTLPTKKFDLRPLQKWDPRIEPDLVVYNAVLNACVQQKQWEGVFWVLQELKQKGIRPTSTTYGLVMEVMLTCGKYNLVYEFFNKVKKSCIPSALNYKVLINALWREGKTEEAILAVKDMEQHGIVGTANLYYDFARCLCTAGRCKEALLQIDKICKVAKKPLVVTYTGLIRTCIDSNNIENAKYIFNQMQNFCAPNVVTCNVMLKLYREHKMFDEANELFNEITNWKVVPDKFTFNTMMEICVENGEFEEFERVFLQMLRHGHRFDSRRHLKMMIDAFRAGKDGALEATWEHFISSNRAPPITLITEIFCLKIKQGHISSAVSCITSFDEGRLQNVSPETWYDIFLNNLNHLEKKNVASLLEEISCMVGSNECKNKIVYKNVLIGCERYLKDVRQPCQVTNTN